MNDPRNVIERRECVCGKASGGFMERCPADRARGYRTCGCGAGPVRQEQKHPMPGVVGQISQHSWQFDLLPDGKVTVTVLEDLSPDDIDTLVGDLNTLVDDLREIERQANAAAPFNALQNALAESGDPAGRARAGAVYKYLIAAGYTVSKLRPRA